MKKLTGKPRRAGVLATLIVGAGPGGIGPLIAARGNGRLDELMAGGLGIIDQGERAGVGELGHYAIRSDSFADSFLAPLGVAAQPSFAGLLQHGPGAQLERQRGGPAALATVADFMGELSASLRQWLSTHSYDPFIGATRALRAHRQHDGSWLTDCRHTDGSSLSFRSKTLVLATGAAQSRAALAQLPVAGQPLLPRFAGKTMLSGELLGQGGAALLAARLRGIQRPRIVIVGGSHSAMSSALFCLQHNDGAGQGAAAVTILHRKPFRITYRTPDEALAEGYTDFGAQDICPRTGRVFPLAGMRSDSRELLRRCWGLGGSVREARLRLHQLAVERDDEASTLLEQADLIVAALGYRPRALPLFDAAGQAIALQAHSGDAALVDDRSRVLDGGRSPVPGVFALGLSAGFPLAGVYGEPSFSGQANGLSLWHGDVGAGIVDQVLEQLRTPAAPRASGPEAAAAPLSGQAATGLPWFHGASHRLLVADTDSVARQVAALLVSQLREVLEHKVQVVLVPSVGRTLQRAYEILRGEYREALDWGRVVCVQMDEYDGLAPGDPRSFAFALRRDLVAPLGIGSFLHFYDAAGRPAGTPLDYEERLRALGGIDCALHGVGRNGHIGFNEPRKRAQSGSAVVRLRATTRAANGVAFQYGVSLGLGLFREARRSIVVMLGAEKREAAHALLFGAPGPHNPVAELRHCPQLHVFLDHAAVPLGLDSAR
ncbi:6-phosphogluconolactonase [Oxalobacteraceae bacterium]|nr:6-phosphogluconolactonase [Oxalobacteraceae bacterium]